MAEQTVTVYADVVSSLWWTEDVVKIWTGNFEPDPLGKRLPEFKPTVQIVMPIIGFVSTVVFMQDRMEAMLAAGVISEEILVSARKNLQDSIRSATGVSDGD